MALTDPWSGEDDDTGYDYYDTGPYEVIHLGGQAAVVVPVTDFLRLRALELHASAEELQDAEDAAAPARFSSLP
jgi:hypothetical protein